MFREIIDGARPDMGRLISGLGLRLPTSWGCRRFGGVARARTRRGASDLGLLSVYLGRGVIPYAEGGKRVHAPSLDLSLYQEVRPGDLVMNNQQAWRGSVGVSALAGIVSPAYLVYEISSDLNREYARHLFQAPAMVDQYVRASKGVGDIQRTVYEPYLRSAIVPVPPADEQSAIVKYLGHAHARIDRAIVAKRKLIALLEEQTQAVIRQVVTRGLDSSVPLKDSGIPWLGEIPVHWETTRAKHLFREFDVRSGTGEERLLSLRAVAGLVFHDQVSDKPVSSESLSKYKKVRPGHLVMNRMRAASGLFAIATDAGLVSPDYATMTVSDSIDARFYLRLFKTSAAMGEFRQLSTGLGTGESGFMRLYTDDFGRVVVPRPPRDEQVAIANHLESDEKESAELASRVLREIDLIREFRTRLTSDVVTGQVDVREIAATLPELSDGELVDDDDESDLDGDGEVEDADE